jgi:hypothetical protein
MQFKFQNVGWYSTHVLSRGHLGKEITSAEHNIELVPEEQALVKLVSDAAERFGLHTVYTAELEDEYLRASPDENDQSDGDNFSESSDVSCADEDASEEMSRGYFPFPSEIFFLLYSYAHNVSKPKVSHICS